MPPLSNERSTPSSWADLNDRQKSYLSAIYDADQEVEQAERSRWSRGGRPRKATEWRWMLYATLDGQKLPVMAHLHARCAIDEGTGSTFAALERRGLLKVRMIWQYSYFGETLTFAEALPQIQITPAGRKLVRGARAIGPAQRLVRGTLREWHWRALALAYRERGNKGVADTGGGYGHIGWNTWLRLREYKPAALICERREGWSSFICLTPFGEAFYVRCFSRYRLLYPDIPAPDPEPACDPFAPYVEVHERIVTCRACQGHYHEEVMTIYCLQQNSTWETTEQLRRLGPATQGSYKQVLQPCLCDEKDIQERQGDFFSLLDQLASMDWQLQFPEFHNWYRYLPYLAHLQLGFQPMYHPQELKQALEPLLLSPENDLQFNVAKGQARLIWNTVTGQGSLYGILENGQEHFAPLAFASKQVPPEKCSNTSS